MLFFESKGFTKVKFLVCYANLANKSESESELCKSDTPQIRQICLGANQTRLEAAEIEIGHARGKGRIVLYDVQGWQICCFENISKPETWVYRDLGVKLQMTVHHSGNIPLT